MWSVCEENQRYFVFTHAVIVGAGFATLYPGHEASVGTYEVIVSIACEAYEGPAGSPCAGHAADVSGKPRQAPVDLLLRLAYGRARQAVPARLRAGRPRVVTGIRWTRATGPYGSLSWVCPQATVEDAGLEGAEWT